MHFLFSLQCSPSYADCDVAHIDVHHELYRRIRETRRILDTIPDCMSINLDVPLAVFHLDDAPPAWFLGGSVAESRAAFRAPLAEFGWVNVQGRFQPPPAPEDWTCDTACLAVCELAICRRYFYWELWEAEGDTRFETKPMHFEELDEEMQANDKTG